jgi:DNA-binding HxlR family transcriptional regulator
MGCALLNIQHLLGKKWSLLLLEELRCSEKSSFNDLSKKLSSITNKQLSDKLRDLQINGVIQKEILNDSPMRVQYSLTQKGLDLQEIFSSMKRWAVKYNMVEDICLETNCVECKHSPATLNLR